MEKVAIIGTGSYALGLAKRITDNNINVSMYTNIENEYNILVKERCNTLYFKEYKLSNLIDISMNLENVITNTNIIILCVPTKYIYNILLELRKYYKNNQYIYIASKGLYENSLLSDIVKKVLHTNKIAVLAGGTFAKDMITDEVLGLTIACKSNKGITIIKEVLVSSNLVIDTSNDIIGVQLFSIMKNIMAILLGLLKGLNYNDSTISLYQTKFICDIMKLIKYYGGKEETFFKYAGYGDITLTTSSPNSRNYSLGLLLAKNNPEEINNYLENTTVEGYDNLELIYNILKNSQLNIDIINIMYDILYNKKDISLIDKYSQTK